MQFPTTTPPQPWLIVTQRGLRVLGGMLTICRTDWKQSLEKARQAAVVQGRAVRKAAISVTAPIPAMVVHTGGAVLVTTPFFLTNPIPIYIHYTIPFSLTNPIHISNPIPTPFPITNPISIYP